MTQREPDEKFVGMATVWRKPWAAPDSAFERVGDFRTQDLAMRFIAGAMRGDVSFSWRVVAMLAGATRFRTLLPSESEPIPYTEEA